MPKIGEPRILKVDVGKMIGHSKLEIPTELPGRITYINHAHRWFLVEATVKGIGTIRDGFKF